MYGRLTMPLVAKRQQRLVSTRADDPTVRSALGVTGMARLGFAR